MLRRILVPLDGSPLAENALPFALSIARLAGAEIHVVLVHVPDTDVECPHAEDLAMDAKAHERQYLEALDRKLRAVTEVPIHVHHLEGIVPETLTEEAVERGIDLVVMNAHGWGYISRALLGSVSDYLMRHLTVPMLLTHTDSTSPDLNRSATFHRVLVCLDGSKLAETILAPVAALGELCKLDYQLLRVVAPLSHAILSHSGQADADQLKKLERARKAASAYLATVVDQLGKQPTVARVAVNANVVGAILQEAKTSACDLIAISTHGRSGLSRLLLGSVADKVIRSTHQAVLVYRPAH